MIDTTGKPEEKKAEVLEDEMDEYADLRMQEMLQDSHDLNSEYMIEY